VGNEIAMERENGKAGVKTNEEREERGDPGSVGP
jgi:hypothetical protein